jgi:hypothetical protein
MVAPASYRAVLKRYDGSNGDVRGHFSELPDLLNDEYPYEVSLAYLFLETEHAHNRALYCGLVKFMEPTRTWRTKSSTLNT